LLPNKPRGFPCVYERRVIDGIVGCCCREHAGATFQRPMFPQPVVGQGEWLAGHGSRIASEKHCRCPIKWTTPSSLRVTQMPQRRTLNVIEELRDHSPPTIFIHYDTLFPFRRDELSNSGRRMRNPSCSHGVSGLSAESSEQCYQISDRPVLASTNAADAQGTPRMSAEALL
jgi:hypothetical protein